MKILKGILIFLFVLILLAGIGLFVFVKTFNINKYKPQIAAALTEQIGRDVAIEGLAMDISLTKGLYAQMVGMKIAEDPQFGFGDFVNITAIKLKVDFMAFLTRREIVVSEVAIESPNISIIRDTNNVINAQKIGPAGAPAATSAASATAPAAASASGELPKFSMQTLVLTDGTVRFIDRTQNPPMDITLSQIRFTIKNFSLTDPFRFEGEAAVFNEIPNMNFSGQAGLDLKTQEVRLSFVEGSFDLDKIALNNLLTALPPLKPAGFKETPDGRISIQIPNMIAGPQGLTSLSLTGKLEGGRIVVESLPVPVEQINVAFSMDAKDLTVSEYSLKMADGTVSGNAKITDYQKAQGLSLKTSIAKISPASLIAQMPEGLVLEGSINGDMNITGSDLANPDLFLYSLNGGGQFSLKDGRLKDFNVLKVLLGRVQFLAGLIETVQTQVSEEYGQYLVRNDTVIREAKSDIKMTNGVIDLPNIVVLSDAFEANMNFSVDPKMNTKADGQVMIQSDLSKQLAEKAEAFEYLKGEDGRVLIPLTHYEGPLLSFKMMPNVKNVAASAIKTEGTKQLDKVLDKVFGPEEPAAPNPDGTPAPAENGSPERQMIKGVLDNLLNKF